MEITTGQPEWVELAVIGGGPAGTAAALEACRRGMRVAVWERERFPRDKVCGEFLSPEALPLLKEEIRGALERGAAIRRSEFISPSGRAHSFWFPRPGRGLSRRALDEALWRAAASAGAETRVGEAVRRVRRVAPSSQVSSGWELETAGGEIRRAQALLVACGRWWTIDGLPSPARENRKGAVGPWMGAKAHFKDVPPRDAVEMYYFPGGYCGLAPIEDGLYNACCLVHRSVVRQGRTTALNDFAAWLGGVARHPVLDARLQGATQVTDTLSTAPLCPARRRAEHDGALLAGDASGFLDPFTGDGISIGLHSGRLAARELAEARSNGRVDSRQAARNYQRQLSSAVRRSYLIAGLLRSLVFAGASVQSSAAAALPWLGARLLEQTRWREAS